MWNVIYIENDKRYVLNAADGEILLEVLQKNGLNVYGSLSQKLNCGGNGICATCGVYMLSKPPEANHWHDQLAQVFGYPRLSCQIRVRSDLTVQKPDGKIIWGQLLPKFKKIKPQTE